jgi:hypothetical protein
VNVISTLPVNRQLFMPIPLAMPNELDEVVSGFEAALWYGELLIASGRQVDPFPAELEALAAVFFAMFPPRSQA